MTKRLLFVWETIIPGTGLYVLPFSKGWRHIQWWLQRAILLVQLWNSWSWGRTVEHDVGIIWNMCTNVCHYFITLPLTMTKVCIYVKLSLVSLVENHRMMSSTIRPRHRIVHVFVLFVFCLSNVWFVFSFPRYAISPCSSFARILHSFFANEATVWLV